MFLNFHALTFSPQASTLGSDIEVPPYRSALPAREGQKELLALVPSLQGNCVEDWPARVVGVLAAKAFAQQECSHRGFIIKRIVRREDCVGAWGSGSFENDDATDWLAQLGTIGPADPTI